MIEPDVAVEVLAKIVEILETSDDWGGDELQEIAVTLEEAGVVWTCPSCGDLAFKDQKCQRCRLDEGEKELGIDRFDEAAEEKLYPSLVIDAGEYDDGRWDDDPNPYHGTYSEE